MRMVGSILFSLILVSGTGALAENPPQRLSLSLADLMAEALEHSPKLKAADLSRRSAESAADSLGRDEFPRLGLNGNYFYQTYVPAFSPFPGSPKSVFGENNNWSAWATLNWDLWDFRSLHLQSESLSALSRSQGQQEAALRRQLILAVRLSYFQAQINLEQVRLLGDSLQVAQAQYSDIQKQAKFGTASRMDRLASHQEALDFERQFRQAQASLASSLRDLYGLVGMPEPADFSLPLDSRMEGKVPQGSAFPTVWITMDRKDKSADELARETRVPPDDSLPQLKTYAYLADSARAASTAVRNSLFPKITLSAQAGWENPDGPVLQTVQQNIVGVSASLPLFDFGSILAESDSKREEAESYLENLSQARLDLRRDWNKARDALRSLEFQQALDQAAVSETEELSRLTYGAYKAGTARFLEVETANMRSFAAKVESAANDLQRLMQLSILSSLSGQTQGGAKP